ncbi:MULTISPECIES: ABC transporter substrate-binding protein [unclassified Streptomyces]|uniref:ABC transporter substrate-binding protein n=1 Tax=unclassified Streptomyces TaxID=2593676 RepID=UPI002257CE83|nr:MULTISPECIES: ABC transporter substrate-binding protein [unclassified Streptomyces]MCX5337777.1 ABC transporter substrate-binding protein [Streptomyces sp. NBC_00140]MCX5365272.1 ABC transporter substrate-binding protein [Streptomyces sp. NBC_00124]
MFNRIRGLRRIAAIASISSLVAGCGVFSSDSSDGGDPIVVGTTSAPATLDPAASWDNSWELFRNVYQTLLNYSPGGTDPEPDAAESCEFTDTSSTEYSCTLREGLKFSNGHTLDAKAVKYSIDRIKKINVNGGPAGLLGTLSRVQVKSDLEVVFHLRQPDATFPLVLTTPAMSIVDPEEYSATEIRKDGEISGSGPYTLDAYDEGKKAELVSNDNYKGIADPQNSAVTIRYFPQSDDMVAALRSKEISVVYRGLAASDTVDIEENQRKEGLQLVENATSEISYLVFNPSDPWAAKPAVRKAVAQIVDRAALVHKVYKDTVQPLYSMVPAGLTGHTTGFFDDFGSPSVAKAKRLLTQAGITEQVPLTLWYTTDRYGSTTKPAFEELKKQLEASGLFTITLKSRPWKTYVEGYQKGEYPVFGRGWFPDFNDADNFIAPFVGEQNALGTPYDAPEITGKLLPESRAESDRGAVTQQIEDAQQILVDDARLLPLWQGKQYVAADEEVGGLENVIDPATMMTMWELYRKTSW